MKMISDENIYGSGLNHKDWYTLCNILLPFLHTKNLSDVEIPEAPEHLSHHPLMEALRAFKNSGDDRFLDQAGKSLVPTDEPFGWYLVVTKS